MKTHTSETGNNRIKILIVEDEELISRSLGRFLKSEGYAVDIASNGREALGLLEGRRYHVIITDLNMPEIDGTEMLHIIMKEKKALPPVVIISSLFSESVLQEEPYNNAFRCINKPFRMEDILSVVKEAVDYAC